uniref:Peptidase M48 n=1 Tax=Eiseniibacteriota bacterium TaxID=2212470 RepID=A0A832MJT4_UNCEI
MTTRALLRFLPLPAALLVMGLVAWGCAVNPATGRRELSLVSAEQELRIGAEGHAAVIAEYGRYEDERLQAYVDSLGQALARVSHLPGLKWTFTVLDDPVVNAFAMPGGYIYVTRGILAHLNSEAQLAGVLGHEIGHVTARHSARRLTQQQLSTLGLGVAAIFSPTVRQYSDAARTALGLIMLKYGRDDENEADQLGVDYATRAGWDPREIPATYEMLGRVGDKAGQRLPAFLSTHPDPGDRQSRTTSLAAAAAAGKSGLHVRGRSYLERMDGVVFGNDPRQGYLEQGRYVHPAMAFELTLPDGWPARDTRQALVAQSPDQRARMQLSIAATDTDSPAAYVQALRAGGRVTGASGGAETVGGLSAWIGRLAVPDGPGGATTLAAAFIRKPPRMFQVLGQSAAPGDANEAKILASARSFRALTDPARLAPTPARVRVVRVATAGEFREVAGRHGPGAPVEDLAILNNRALDETVRAGELVKVVTPAKLR